MSESKAPSTEPIIRLAIEHFVDNLSHHPDDRRDCELCDEISNLLPELLCKAFGIDHAEIERTDK